MKTYILLALLFLTGIAPLQAEEIVSECWSVDGGPCVSAALDCDVERLDLGLGTHQVLAELVVEVASPPPSPPPSEGGVVQDFENWDGDAYIDSAGCPWRPVGNVTALQEGSNTYVAFDNAGYLTIDPAECPYLGVPGSLTVEVDLNCPSKSPNRNVFRCSGPDGEWTLMRRARGGCGWAPEWGPVDETKPESCSRIYAHDSQLPGGDLYQRLVVESDTQCPSTPTQPCTRADGQWHRYGWTYNADGTGSTSIDGYTGSTMRRGDPPYHPIIPGRAGFDEICTFSSERNRPLDGCSLDNVLLEVGE
jgi:hypothetical protein